MLVHHIKSIKLPFCNSVDFSLKLNTIVLSSPLHMAWESIRNIVCRKGVWDSPMNKSRLMLLSIWESWNTLLEKHHPEPRYHELPTGLFPSFPQLLLAWRQIPNHCWFDGQYLTQKWELALLESWIYCAVEMYSYRSGIYPYVSGEPINLWITLKVLDQKNTPPINPHATPLASVLFCANLSQGSLVDSTQTQPYVEFSILYIEHKENESC